MRSVEIPRRDWTKRLSEFNKKYEGWLVTLDIASQPGGVQHEFRQLPLVGFTAEKTNGRTISVAVEEATGEHLTHRIYSPQHVFVQETDAGVHAAVEIVGGDGTKSIVRLRTVAA